MEEYLNKLRGDAFQRGNNALVFVEDFADVNFWWYLFAHFVPHVKPNFPPTEQGGNSALKAEIMPYLGVKDGVALCIAWDSDNTHLYSTTTFQPYVFETVVYTGVVAAL